MKEEEDLKEARARVEALKLHIGKLAEELANCQLALPAARADVRVAMRRLAYVKARSAGLCVGCGDPSVNARCPSCKAYEKQYR